MNPDNRPHDPRHGSGDAAEIDALLAGHALGDLDSDEREQLAALLQRDPRLRERLDEFRTSLQLLPLALPATATPPPRLRRRLLQRGRRSTPNGDGQAAAGGGERRGGAQRLVPALLGLALLAMGLQLHRTRQQLARLEQRFSGIASSTVPAPASGGRHLQLVAVQEKVPAEGEVLVTGNSSHNVLMLDNLPPPPQGHVYRLWAEVDGRTVGCVAFRPSEQGHVGMLIPPQPTSRARSLRVSIEPDPMGSVPTGPIVLQTVL